MMCAVFTITLHPCASALYCVSETSLKCSVQRVFDEVISQTIGLEPTCNPVQMELELLHAELNERFRVCHISICVSVLQNE